MGMNGNKRVVLCSINGTVTSGADGSPALQACGGGYVCAPLSRSEIAAAASFDASLASTAGAASSC